ncbi:IS701 family transposase [Sphaerisporangium melleum]|uniref:IS701 family transposase n=1 Tax=Sphaerisporangium melleum TaxID=321316 RepID=UPI0019509843|nr:transposase [Sphaerisporangium melleum]
MDASGPARPKTADAIEAVTEELAEVVFASFPRRDQRTKGMRYLRGLLSARGRKSIRNIAAQVGGPGAEQSLHHFISSSTWDWKPVRAALAGHLAQLSPPEVWVVQPMTIPKAGHRSVGVDQSFDAYLGRPFRGQRAFGVWSSSQRLASPIEWRLFLPDTWVRDGSRRRRAEVPESVTKETMEECAIAALESVRSWHLPSRPVVLNTHVCDVASTIGRFRDAGLQVVARVCRAARLTVRDPALPGYGEGTLSALQILGSARDLRRPAESPAPATGSAPLVAAVRVGLAGAPSRSPAAEQGLVLLGEWDDPLGPPRSMWITTMDTAPLGTLLRLTRHATLTEASLRGLGEAVGLKDFEGRSFRGWHRHVTMASAAYAVAALTGAAAAGHRPRSA